MAISTNGTVLARVAGALYNTQMSNATYEEVKTLDPSSLADALFARDFSSATDATVATTLVTNLGLTAVEGLANWVAAQLTAAGSHKGAKVVELLNGFAQMSADATYGAAATAFNTKVDAALALSQTTGNAGGTFAAAGTAPVSGGTFTLTTGADLAGVNVGSNGGVAASFRFTSGNETVSALTATTAGGDTLIDGSTTDADVLNLTATGAMTALTAINIETANVNFASGTTASAIFTNFSGLNTVNVTGVVAGTVEDAGTAAIALDGYKRVLTVDIDSLAGTASAATADVLNVSVSGTTYGSTASTRSGINVTIQSATDATDGTLETLNITSAGTAANTYSLAKDADTTFNVINLLGATEQTIRVEHNDVTGVSIAGGAATGDVNVRVNRESDGTTATNVVNFTGVDNLIIADDATTPAAAMVLTGVASGQKITVAKDMATSSSISMAGTSTGVNAASLTLVLDNDTANRDTDIGGNLSIQDTTLLNLVSNGYASTATDGSAENALTLIGDFTTVTVTGDTSIDLTVNMDGAGSAGTTARAVAVNASGLTGTARADITASTNQYVTYNITGTANDDTLTANASGNTLTGGAGNDVLTGGTKNDVISGGDGADTINASAGTDTVTLGADIDTVIFGEGDVTAVAQVTTLANSAGVTLAAGDQIVVTVNGITYAQIYATSSVATHAAFVTAHAANILASTGVTVTSVDTDTDLAFTGASSGATFTLTGLINDAGVPTAYTPTATTAAVSGITVQTNISDFVVGTGGDVIAFDVSDMNDVTGIAVLTDSTNAVVGGDDVILANYTAGTALAATSVDAGANVIKVAYSTGINSFSDLSTAIDGANISLDADKDNDGVITVFYDADDGVMRVGVLYSTGDDAEVFDDTLVFNEVSAITMTGVQYASLTAANFSFVA